MGGTGDPPGSPAVAAGEQAKACTPTPTEPYPGYAREAAALAEKVAAARRAQAAPLPGPLREAFAGDPRRVTTGGRVWTFEPVCAWLVAILVRIESPLLGIIRIAQDEMRQADPDGRAMVEARIAARVEAEIKPAPDAVLETVFAFLTPVEQCQELLDYNRLEYTVAARKLLGKLHPAHLAELERACGEHFSASFVTALNISAKAPEGGNGEVFSQPPPAPTMASAASGSPGLSP